MSIKKQKTTINWDKQIKVLTKFAKKNGYNVVNKKVPTGISTICFSEKIITMHSNLNEERKFYTLLHELGHMIINEKFSKKKYNQIFDYQYTKFSKKSMVYKVVEIEEEIEAWRLGFKLTKKLKLKINRNTYEIYKSSLIKTYMVRAC